MNTNSRLTIGQVVGLGAALLVLLLFFFPWVEFNLLLASVNMSGYQLATGSGPVGSKFPGVPSLWLVPLSMLGVLALLGSCFLNQKSQLRSIAGVLLIVAGGISAVVILYQYLNLNHELNQNPVGLFAQNLFSYSFGAHGALVGSGGVAVGGVIDLMTAPKTVPTA
jgi:ABC-type transport system involved in cytochrome c biogenesis permease subunit